MRIKRAEEKIIIAFRDNGKNFNPLEYSVAEEEGLHTDGIVLPKNLRAKQFLIHWTIKEAYFKLTGYENFLQADCEKILAGNKKIIGKNFFLK